MAAKAASLHMLHENAKFIIHDLSAQEAHDVPVAQFFHNLDLLAQPLHYLLVHTVYHREHIHLFNRNALARGVQLHQEHAALGALPQEFTNFAREKFAFYFLFCCTCLVLL